MSDPSSTMEPARSEKVFAAEKRLTGLRLLVVTLNTLVYLFLLDKTDAVPWLADAIIVAAFGYGLYVFRFEPFRRHALLRSSYFTSITDSALIMLWVYATGAVHSPFYVVLYLSVVAIAFRYSSRETAIAALIYGGSYGLLLAALGQVAGHLADITVRIGYVFLCAFLGGLMSRELLLQTEAQIASAEQLRRETEAEERRMRFLADASATLGASLDYETTLSSLMHMVVPVLGDTCVVDLIDDDGAVRRVAEAALDPAKEELLRKLRDHPPSSSRPGSPFHRVVATGETVYFPELSQADIDRIAGNDEYARIIRAIAPASSLTVPLKSRGRVLGAITFGTLPPGRRLGERDRALAEELGRRAGIAVDNARLFREARDAVGLRDSFLSIASHELKTPLTSLKLQADGLIRRARKSDSGLSSDAIVERAEKISGQTERLDKLVNELLDVSRVTSGRLTLDLQDVDLAEVAREVVARFEEVAAEARSPVTLRAETVVGRWDPMRLDQVVTNLVSNALKYGAGKPVEVVVVTDGKLARLSVCDRGIGIADKDRARLFQRFERLVSDRQYHGFGLGLWIARQMVEALGGALKVQSELGAGSTFTVELPLVQ